MHTLERIEEDRHRTSDYNHVSEKVRETATLADACRDLARQDPVTATEWVHTAERLVRDSFAGAQREGVHPGYAFAAASATVEALQQIGAWGAARGLANAMLEWLSGISETIIMQECLRHTLAAFGSIGGLSDWVVDTAEALARSTEQSVTWAPYGAMHFAVKFASASAAPPRRLAHLAVELAMLHQFHQAVTGAFSAQWYRPALDVLGNLVTAGHVEPAATLAQALLRHATDNGTNWYARAAILGGLVRSSEQTTREESMRRFLVEDAFPDHVADLPIDLLQRLVASDALRDLS